MTEQRKTIAKVIADSEDHPSADDVYSRACKIDTNISLATVYRTINLLEGYGIIEKLDFKEGKARYEEKIKQDTHHHHLIDLDSGDIIEFQDKELEELKVKIAKRLGYDLIDHRLELYGKKLKK
jgi:Fur family ferric uptake transcriptional regulator